MSKPLFIEDVAAMALQGLLSNSSFTETIFKTYQSPEDDPYQLILDYAWELAERFIEIQNKKYDDNQRKS